MFTRLKSKALLAGLALAIMPTLALGQIFSDTEFLAADYDTDTNVAANSTFDFNLDYSNIDRFGGFLTASLPEAPNSPGGATATTGVFITVNDDSLNGNSGVETFAAIMPKSSLVNVGTGTANPNYKMSIDVFHSSAAGVDDGLGNITLTGSTNYAMLGINQSNTTVQLGGLNSPGAGNGGLAGQGLGLAITGDTGAGDDYIPFYGGARYADRDLGEEPGQLHSQASNSAAATVSTGLLGDHLNDLWEAQGLGFEFDDTDEDFLNDLARNTSNATYLAPDPNDLAGYPIDSVKQPLVDAFPLHTDPLHYSCGGSNCGLTGSQVLVDTQTGLSPGVPVNEWMTHELYWVDGEFTYVIDGVPVQQITPDNDGAGGDDNIFNSFSDSGTPLLAFWDRFGGSISISPEGANFVVFDNLNITTATTGDAPDLDQYLIAQGLLPASSNTADADGDGDVDGSDFLKLQRENPAGITDWVAAYPAAATSAAGAVPEPSSAILLLGLSLGMLSRRRR